MLWLPLHGLNLYWSLKLLSINEQTVEILDAYISLRSSNGAYKIVHSVVLLQLASANLPLIH